MIPEGNNLTDVGSPGREEAKAAEVLLTETTPQKIFAQPVNSLIHLFRTNKIVFLV